MEVDISSKFFFKLKFSKSKWTFFKALIQTDTDKRIVDAFLIFDHHGNKTVDVREVGTILRYLGL